MANIEELLAVSALTAKNKIKADSRLGYNGKIKYCIKFMEENYPDQVGYIGDARKPKLLIPLSFQSIEALFARLTVDTELPRSAKKRKKEDEERREELDRIRQAAINRGDADIPEIIPPIVDNSINKENSITVLKSCLGGYKSALKTYYSDNGVAFECLERPPGSVPLDEFLDNQIKSYGNLIADKKQRAVMPVTEGKDAMVEEGFNRLISDLIKFKPEVLIGNHGKVGDIVFTLLIIIK